MAPSHKVPITGECLKFENETVPIYRYLPNAPRVNESDANHPVCLDFAHVGNNFRKNRVFRVSDAGKIIRLLLDWKTKKMKVP